MDASIRTLQLIPDRVPPVHVHDQLADAFHGLSDGLGDEVRGAYDVDCGLHLGDGQITASAHELSLLRRQRRGLGDLRHECAQLFHNLFRG